MERTIALALNKFSAIPSSLRDEHNATKIRSELNVQLASLYHHYFLDSYGKVPPDPDPAQFEYLQFLVRTTEFRLIGDGIGVSTAKRRHSSTELGQACRWFLQDHLGIVYFAHMHDALNGRLGPSFASYRIERTGKGDMPDYFCAETADRVFLAEAKGRYSSISFGSAVNGGDKLCQIAA